MTDRSTIPQFTGAAYQGWAYKVQYGLIEKELHSVVFAFRGRPRTPCPALIPLLTQGEISAPNPPDARVAAARDNEREISVRNVAIENWLDLDLKAQSFIVKYLGASEHTHVRNCTYAWEMWAALKSFYELQGEIEVANANAQLSAIIMAEAEDITLYVRRLQEIHSLLDRLGEPVPATKQATNFINSLNSHYSPMVKVVQTWAQTAPHLYTVQSILSTLVQEDVRETINARKRGEPLGGHGMAAANYGGADTGGNRSGYSGGGKGSITCHRCGKPGHLKSDCTIRVSFDASNIQCHFCEKMGHYKNDCPKNMAGNGGGNDRNRNCSYCKQRGHSIDACRAKIRDEQGAAKLATFSDPNFDASRALTYTAARAALSLTSNSPSSLILDSGATDHIFPLASCFTNYTTVVPLDRSFIHTADDKPHEVKGQGIVTLRLHRGTETVIVALQALHVPTLGQTLISLGCINKRGGVEFHLSKNGIPTLTQHNQPWVDAKSTANGLLLLSGRVVMPDVSTGATPKSVIIHQALSVGIDWHLRLKQPGLTMMNALYSKSLIPKLTPVESADVSGCQICCQAKMGQSPHKAVGDDTHSCHKMDRVHLDLVGPFAVSSAHGGYTYFQSGIEVATRLSFVNLLKKKSEALEKSKIAFGHLENESGLKLKSMRTDGGGSMCQPNRNRICKAKTLSTS